MTQQQSKSKPRPLARAALLLAGSLGLANAALAQLTDVASVPLSTASPTVVKPNVMFILDDSGSMARDYMPDDVNDFNSGTYGRYTSQCNGLAFNTATTYTLPVDSTGANYPAGTFTFPSPADLNNVRNITSAVPTIGVGSFTVTLSSGSSGSYPIGNVVTFYSDADTSKLMVGTVTAWNSTSDVLTVNVTSTQGSGALTTPRIGDGDNRPFFYTYSGAQTHAGLHLQQQRRHHVDDLLPAVRQRCRQRPGQCCLHQGHRDADLLGLQSYRNWYTYYRTRSLTMRSATSLAFGAIGDRFRVGFSTISTRSVSGSDFLDVADFDAAHKALFYTELFGAAPLNYTPLRGALSKAGKYFAKRASRSGGGAQTYDPMQYSCQRNFAILTTDGYWNTGDGDSTYDPGDEFAGSGSNSYGPDRLDNTDVGQQDGGATPRPRKDGESSVLQTRTSNLQQRTITPQWTTGTTTLQSRTVTGSWQTSTSSLQPRTQAPGSRHLEQRPHGPTWTGWAAVTAVMPGTQTTPATLRAVPVRLGRLGQRGYVHREAPSSGHRELDDRNRHRVPVHGVVGLHQHGVLHGAGAGPHVAAHRRDGNAVHFPRLRRLDSGGHLHRFGHE